MITPKIKALFHFIEYLHTNIHNFKQYDEVINELHFLSKERDKVRPRLNFKDKMKYDEVHAEIGDKFNVIEDNIIKPIIRKAKDLNICDLNSEPDYYWYGVELDIQQLKDNFSKDDLPEIFSHKNKYLEYRTKTKGEFFFGLWSLFNELEEILKTLFDYFKEIELNEFEAFETKPIQTNDIEEAAELLQKGHKKIMLPNSFLNPLSVHQQQKNTPLPPQPITEQRDELIDLITHKKSHEIVEGIKIQYKNIKGKRLKILCLALQDLGLLPKERIAKKFHDCCKKEFDWDIASYNAMNGYLFNDNTDNDEFISMKQFIESLTKKD